ncbi:uncharacterized mitochondrial protein AtMg00810-like [Juglans regia]|uniref:Uncharacterized mitochondrial protein AtMg00810-like n=1 Tax=Juglans regia TaxID=51240 RepID=A0A6P9ECS8_JUGRE|nr:uncharacterized mitochondrial protein AtMg00810-like [Juglans regia]
MAPLSAMAFAPVGRLECISTRDLKEDVYMQQPPEFVNPNLPHHVFKDLGPLQYFLGIEVSRNPSSLYLSQSKYISDLLFRSNMHQSKPISIPLSASIKLTALDGHSFKDPQFYRSIIGRFQYLAVTQPDISFAVNKVCQFMHYPRLPHWHAVKRIL